MLNHRLTPKQAEAFKELERAFAKCGRLKIIVWDNYGHISAVDGNKVLRPVTSGSDIGGPDGMEELDTATVASFAPKCWGGSNADDRLYIEKA